MRSGSPSTAHVEENTSGRPRPGGEVAFDVFAAMGYANDRPVFLRLEASLLAGGSSQTTRRAQLHDGIRPEP